MFLSRNRKSIIALEAIDFQNDNFGLRIEGIVARIYKNIDDTIGLSRESVALMPEVKELEMVIKTRLGFGVKIDTSTALAAVQPFFVQPSSIFIPDMWQGSHEAKQYVDSQISAMLKKGKLKATVNTADATVGGFFADVVIDLYIDFVSLKKEYNIDVKETTAIILHELGHAFYAMEYSDRMDGNNQVLAELAKTALNKKKDTDVNYIYRELKTINPKMRREELDKLMSSDKTIASYHWFKFVVDSANEGVGSQLDNGSYNRTSFEQMADNFASRFGYGRHITIALDKLTKSGWSPEKYRGAWVFFQIMAVLAFALMATCLAVALAGGFLIYAFLSAVVLMFIIGGSGESGRNYTYDKLKIRYVRIRNDMIQSLKNSKLDTKQTKIIVDNIYVTDSIIKSTSEFNTLLDGFLNIISSSNRNAGRSIREEQLLEELASNALFIKAAELRIKS